MHIYIAGQDLNDNMGMNRVEFFDMFVKSSDGNNSDAVLLTMLPTKLLTTIEELIIDLR